MIRLLQVTDPHLFGDESRSIYGVNTALSFRRVLEQALPSGSPLPDAILATGDIADDHSEEAYANFKRALSSYDVPVYCIPGNHDDPALMHRMLNSGRLQTCGSATFGAWGAVFIDTHLPRSPAGLLSDAELARLERELKRFAGRPTLVCLHHPAVDVGSKWLDGVGLRNAAAVREIIGRHPDVRVMLAGHVHQAFDRGLEGVRMLTTPSTCAQFTPGLASCLMDMRPPGYRWLHLLPDGGVETDVAWLRDWEMRERPRDDRYEGGP